MWESMALLYRELGANPNEEWQWQMALGDNPKKKFKFVEWSSNAKCKNQILASGHHFLLPLCAKFEFYGGMTNVYGW